MNLYGFRGFESHPHRHETVGKILPSAYSLISCPLRVFVTWKIRVLDVWIYGDKFATVTGICAATVRSLEKIVAVIAPLLTKVVVRGAPFH